MISYEFKLAILMATTFNKSNKCSFDVVYPSAECTGFVSKISQCLSDIISFIFMAHLDSHRATFPMIYEVCS